MAAPHVNLYPLFIRPPQVYPTGTSPANINVAVGGSQVTASVSGTEIAVAGTSPANINVAVGGSQVTASVSGTEIAVAVET